MTVANAMDARSAAPAGSGERTTRLASRLADHGTPLIASCWYVAGWSTEFTRTPAERVILGRNLVFYRTEEGRPVALHNRCPHRSFPLSKGHLEGDNLRCGYHGLVFDPCGVCVEVPSQDIAPRGIGVRAYAVAERKPFVWIWMGASDAADEAAIPDTGWLDSPDWSYASSYIHLKSNYVGLHENLLDLTHFTYLHPTTLGTPEYARTPFTVDTAGDRVRISRFVPECDPPPIYAGPTGLTGKKMSRLTTSEFVSPAFHGASAVLADLRPDPGARREFTVRISHFLTPESQDATHYFFTFARDFALGDEGVTAFMEKGALEAFYEDVDALESITEVERREHGTPFQEINIKSDQAGVATRRVLRRMADAEARH